MNYSSLDDFIANGKEHVAKGPIAIIIVEDLVEVASTLKHHIMLGFKKVIVLANDLPEMSHTILDQVVTIKHNLLKQGTKDVIIN